MKQTTSFFLLCSISLIYSACRTNTAANNSDNISKRVIQDVECFDNLKDAQLASSESRKEIFVIFDSPVVGCCRKSTYRVFEFIKNNDSIRDNYEIAYLQIDDRTKVNSTKELELGGKLKKAETVGDENMFLMIELFDLVSPYYYVVMDKELNILKEPIGFFSDEESIRNYL